jgi:hypothetical protein
VGADDQVSDTIDIEQTRRDLEEIDVLREMDQRTLLSVTETEVNGSAAARAYLYKYVLSDGRIKTVGEGGFDRSRPSPDQVTRDQQAMDALRVQGNYDVRKIIDVEVQGHVQRTLICRYTLSGGREQTRGESDPSLSAPGVVLDSEQDRELMRLVSLKNGELLSASKAQMFGKTFIFQRFLYTLPDRTVVMYSEGQPYPKAELADADWNELNDLRKSGAGVTLGTFQQEFRGQLLNFTRVKYVLSDGTEVIQSRGEAVQEQ